MSTQNTDGWLQDGGLLYRLTDDRSPVNRDEISVTMANGSRRDEARARRASELLCAIRQRRNLLSALEAAISTPQWEHVSISIRGPLEAAIAEVKGGLA